MAEAEPLLAAAPSDDLRQNEAPPVVHKPWYRRWWVYAVFGFLLFWFGTPYLLQFFIAQPGATPNYGFTSSRGSAPTTPTGPVDVVTSDDPSRGFAAAPVVIVEFGDFQCPFCREAAPIVARVLAKYPDAVRFIYRDFPLVEGHDQALAAAEAANCAAQQGKFWEFHDRFYAEQERLGDDFYVALAREFGLDLARFARCREGHLTLQEIEEDYAAGVAAGVGGTPTWFVNGYRLQGALPAELWERIIAEVVKRAFHTPPRT